ncbi:hypothetical protein F4677DRAFT_249214 [Hypoxylon crocopeplum]|nr:hypothetical protein F4677DRAFT_249214 [Hypoxylon crocopeplum]
MKMLLTVIACLALLGQGIAQDTGIKACAYGCVNGVFLNGVSMGCAMNDRVCVCGKTTDFTDGIRDCVNQVCENEDPASQVPLAQAFGADQCQAASSAAGLLPTPTPTPQPSAPEPTQQAPATTPAVAETTAASSLDAASATDQSSVSSSTSAAASGYTGISSGATSDAEEPDGGSSSDGLSIAARAGIGAGVGVAVVILFLLAVFMFMRRRQKKKAAQRPRAANLQISQPLPGSGRQYAENMHQTESTMPKTFTPSPQSSHASRPAPVPTTPPSPSAVSYSSELDANSRRYEDLLPRTQPHTMI